MKLADVSVTRPVFALMLSAALVLVGIQRRGVQLADRLSAISDCNDLLNGRDVEAVARERLPLRLDTHYRKPGCLFERNILRT